MLKRFLAPALIFGIVSTGALSGCGETSEVKKEETVTAPGGTTTTTETEKVKSTGDNPPPSSTGETGKTAEPGKTTP